MSKSAAQRAVSAALRRCDPFVAAGNIEKGNTACSAHERRLV